MFDFLLSLIRLLAENGFSVNIENQGDRHKVSFGFDKDKSRNKR